MEVTTTPKGARYWISLVIIGLIGGLLSGAFGVGGGIIMVPLLISFVHMDQRRAAATSLVAIIPTALVGSIAYFVNDEIDLLAAGIIAAGASWAPSSAPCCCAAFRSSGCGGCSSPSCCSWPCAWCCWNPCVATSSN
nr:sulfite exporter TauE/SafE family protein [Cryobacterium sp. MLB-32]